MELIIDEKKNYFLSLENSWEQINILVKKNIKASLFISLIVREDSNLNIYIYHENKSNFELKINGVNYNSLLNIKVEDESLNKEDVKSLQKINIINFENAKTYVSPCLKVDSNLVNINHEMYIGPIKKNKLFYLMSRGLTKKESEDLILEAFFKRKVRKE